MKEAPIDFQPTRAETDPDRTANSERNERSLEVVAWLANNFDQPFSDTAVAARLPEGYDLSRPADLSQALSAVGLKSTVLNTDLRTIDPIVLPCVVFDRDGAPLILRQVLKRGRTAEIVIPGQQPEVSELPTAELQSRVGKEVVLVTPKDEASGNRLSPGSQLAPAKPEHWFWAPVRANWGSWMQIVVASLLLNTMALALPLFVMNVYDKVLPSLSFVTLWTLAIGVALAIFLDLVLRTVRAYVLETISRRVDLKVASSLFRHAMNVSLMQRKSGATGIANQIREYEAVREFFASSTFVSFVDLLFIGIFLAVLFAIVGPLALVPTLAIPIVLTIALATRIPILRTADKAIQMSAKRYAILMESLLGIETIKSLNAEPTMQREWENAVAASARVNGKTRFWSNFAISSTFLVQQMVSVCIIVWGVYLIAENQISIGGLIAANILAGRALAPLSMIAQTIFRAQYAFRSLNALNRLMDLPTDRREQVKSNLKVKSGAFRASKVTFTYPDAQNPSIENLSLAIEPAEKIAVLGRVGSGKTTLGKLMCGLIAPDKGTLLVDGFGLNQYDPAELRDGIGYLPQQVELFTGTLRENLLIGRPNASQTEIEQALHYSGLDGFVARSTAGLDLFIGEQGNQLSGGQAQALALARVLLRTPKLLFLDEPTNAMDQEMETTICARLSDLNATGVGLVLSTHRQSLAAIATRFVVLDGGRKVLDGPKQDIMQRLLKKKPDRAGPG